MQTFAILGQQPELSAAEIETVLGKPLERQSKEVAIFDLPTNGNTVPAPTAEKGREEIERLQKTLGGSSKLGWIVGRCTPSNIVDELTKQWKQVRTQNKFNFGISVYDLGDEKATKKLRSQANRLGLKVKSGLKRDGRSVRFVTSKEETLSSVVVSKNGMEKNGGELVLLVTPKNILIGRTVTVQDFEDWSHRDFDRPARDARSGMLPPKLARMMVNLSGADVKTSTLLDPFCGSGTVLMEAGILGCKEMIGSDLSEKAVNDTGTNLQWLEDNNILYAEVDLYQSAAADLSAHVPPSSIDVMVMEPFLGNPRTGRETVVQVKQAIEDLTTLYEDSFATLYKLLKPDGVMVIASPVHYVNKTQIGVPTRDILQDLGMKSAGRTDLHYRRPDQFVGRDIVIMKKG